MSSIPMAGSFRFCAYNLTDSKGATLLSKWLSIEIRTGQFSPGIPHEYYSTGELGFAARQAMARAHSPEKKLNTTNC